MVAEFNWWLLIVGVVAGGVLTWLVLADTTRREREIADEELMAEAAWITKAVGGRVALGFTPYSGRSRAGIPELLSAAGFAQVRVVDTEHGFCVLALKP